MLYRFKCGAAGDVVMTGARGEQLLTIIGKTPASRGIVAAEDLPEAIQALEHAVADEEAGTAPLEHDEVTLRQRAWPLLDMFRQARDARMAVVWGV